jgi:magnesium-transporting ATPase (P-type)
MPQVCRVLTTAHQVSGQMFGSSYAIMRSCWFFIKSCVSTLFFFNFNWNWNSDFRRIIIDNCILIVILSNDFFSITFITLMKKLEDIIINNLQKKELWKYFYANDRVDKASKELILKLSKSSLKFE